jgi:long-subunit acyl-CoA synthetase (AMP-forming)
MDAEQTKPQLRPQEASIKSRFQAEIPLCSVQKWVFSSLSTEDLHRKAWIDSDSPGTHFLTFAEACLLAKRIALGLLKQGLRPGDRVLLFAGNSIFYPPMVLGIWMACGVFTGASPGFSAHELAFQLQDSQATFMIAGRYHLDTALSAAKVVGMNQDQVFIMDADPLDVTSKAYKEHGGLHHWTDLLASRDEGQAFIWDEPADPRTTTCTLNYSSGTVGTLDLRFPQTY